MGKNDFFLNIFENILKMGDFELSENVGLGGAGVFLASNVQGTKRHLWEVHVQHVPSIRLLVVSSKQISLRVYMLCLFFFFLLVYV